MEELSVEKELIKEVSRCMDLLREMFATNNIRVGVATDAMLSLIASLYISNKFPLERFEGLLLRTIEEAKKQWHTDE